jgi:transcriptional regulator with XRE-family HTH domain
MQISVKSMAISVAKRQLHGLSLRVPTVKVAADTGIHQSQVSRLLRGQFKRLSPNVLRLLEYARKPQRYTTKHAAQEAAKNAVIRAALRTWDSTPRGAQALVRLLRSIEKLRDPWGRMASDAESSPEWATASRICPTCAFPTSRGSTPRGPNAAAFIFSLTSDHEPRRGRRRPAARRCARRTT